MPFEKFRKLYRKSQGYKPLVNESDTLGNDGDVVMDRGKSKEIYQTVSRASSSKNKSTDSNVSPEIYDEVEIDAEKNSTPLIIRKPKYVVRKPKTVQPVYVIEKPVKPKIIRLKADGTYKRRAPSIPVVKHKQPQRVRFALPTEMEYSSSESSDSSDSSNSSDSPVENPFANWETF